VTDAARLSCSACPGISWVVEEYGVRVIDEIARQSETLEGAEAVVWELLLAGHEWPEVAGVLQCAIGVPLEQAEDLITDCLRVWVEAGWLQRADAGRG